MVPAAPHGAGGLALHPECSPHSPGETPRGCWRAVSCLAAAEGSPPLTSLENTTHMAMLGWEWEQEGARAVQSRRLPPPNPFFTHVAPRASRGNSSQAPYPGWGHCATVPGLDTSPALA